MPLEKTQKIKGKKKQTLLKKSKCSCEGELYLLQNQPHVLANIDEFYHLRLLLPTQDAEWPHHLGEGLPSKRRGIWKDPVQVRGGEWAWHIETPPTNCHSVLTRKRPWKKNERQMREGRKDYFLFRMSLILLFEHLELGYSVAFAQLSWYFWTKIWWKLAWLI